jgi:hypothetical protein
MERVISDIDLIENELDEEFELFLRKRGFRTGKHRWYHPWHWSVEHAGPGKNKGKYLVGDEVYVPLTYHAEAWVKKNRVD